MKKPRTIYWDKGVMKSYETIVRPNVSLTCIENCFGECGDVCPIISVNRMTLDKYHQKVKAARANALSVADESKEKVEELLKPMNLDVLGDFDWQPDKTKSYQIEAEMREGKGKVIAECRYSKCDCATGNECFEYEKVLVLVECSNGCDWPNCTVTGCVDPKCDC